MSKIWHCKIGEVEELTQNGLDFPMRVAVKEAYMRITGEEPKFCFSGWAGELDEYERAVVEHRAVKPRTRWRIGAKVPINVYEGDRPICQCHTVEDAKEIVRAVNHWRDRSRPSKGV